MYISPNYQDTDFVGPLSVDDKITIFSDRTYGWQLDIADQLINGKRGPDGGIIVKAIPHSGFAALSIVLSYFEMIAKYRDGFRGKGKSESYFKQGVYSVFPQLKTGPSQIVDSLLDVIYSGGRCSLYHSAITNRQIILSCDTKVPMGFDPHKSILEINPCLLPPGLEAHLQDYVKQLRNVNNSLLRENFEKRFDFDVSQTSQ